jgi:hypothetical protein
MKPLVIILGLVTAGGFFAGCAPALIAGGAAAGAGTALYLEGDLETVLDASFEESWTATLAVLTEKGVTVVSREEKINSGHIKGRMEDGARLKVIIQGLTRKTTEISIRIGTIGDEQRSKEILRAIQARL